MAGSAPLRRASLIWALGMFAVSMLTLAFVSQPGLQKRQTAGSSSYGYGSGKDVRRKALLNSSTSPPTREDSRPIPAPSSNCLACELPAFEITLPPRENGTTPLEIWAHLASDIPDFPFHVRVALALRCIPRLKLTVGPLLGPIEEGVSVVAAPHCDSRENILGVAKNAPAGATVIYGPWNFNLCDKLQGWDDSRGQTLFSVDEWTGRGCTGTAQFQAYSRCRQWVDTVAQVHLLPTMDVHRTTVSTHAGAPVVYLKARPEGPISWTHVAIGLGAAGLVSREEADAILAAASNEAQEAVALPVLRALASAGRIRLFLTDWGRREWYWKNEDFLRALASAPYIFAFTVTEPFGSFVMETMSTDVPIFLLQGYGCAGALDALEGNSVLLPEGAHLATAGACVQDVLKAGAAGGESEASVRARIEAAWAVFALRMHRDHVTGPRYQPRVLAEQVFTPCAQAWRYLQMLHRSGVIRVSEAAAAAMRLDLTSCAWKVERVARWDAAV